jgi:hypothetical protein
MKFNLALLLKSAQDRRPKLTEERPDEVAALITNATQSAMTQIEVCSLVMQLASIASLTPQTIVATAAARSVRQARR